MAGVRTISALTRMNAQPKTHKLTTRVKALFGPVGSAIEKEAESIWAGRSTS
jgi:hypothetical protein